MVHSHAAVSQSQIHCSSASTQLTSPISEPGGAKLFAQAQPSRVNPICVLGPLFLDIIMSGLPHPPQPGQEQWVDNCAIMAGGCANQAVALSRLGCDVALYCPIGTDAAGKLVRSQLQQQGICLEHCLPTPAQNITVSLAFAQDRALTTAGTMQTLPLNQFPLQPAIVLGDLSTLAAGKETITTWRKQPFPTAVLADSGWDSSGAWDPDMLQTLAIADVFTPNAVEAQLYTRSQTPLQAAKILAQKVPLAVVTCGAHGVIACDEKQLVELPAVPVANVVDTTGAGDSFSAGLVWGLSQGLSLRAALSLASLIASYTLTRPGSSANTPTCAQIAAYTHATELSSAYDLSFLDLPAFA